MPQHTSKSLESLPARGLKRMLDEYVVNANVEVRLFTRLIGTDVHGRKILGFV